MRLAAAAVLPLVPLLWTPFVADAAGPTCQGKPATIVGKPGGTVRGTTGPDVVVSRGASFVNTGDGDDVVCITGSTDDGYRVRFTTGGGNDSVLVTTTNTVRGYLGHGEDTFVGGHETDIVSGGELEFIEIGGDAGEQYVDRDPDTISTGGGDDSVDATSDDTIALGRGDDVLSWAGSAGEAFTGEAEGGPGRNLLALNGRNGEDEDPGGWVLDNRVGTLSRDGEVRYSWTGFTRFYVDVDGALLMRGSARNETFESASFRNAVAVRAGGGDDEIRVGIWNEQNVDSIDGGPGRDLLDVAESRFVGEASFVLDLAAGSYRYRDRDGRAKVPLVGIEDAEVTGFPRVIMRGDSKANRLTARVVQQKIGPAKRCPIVLSGKGGDDRLTVKSAKPESSSKNCPAPILRGDGGNDLLVGSRVDEKLLGGPGRDVARGGPGTDVCIAETRLSCERR